MKDKLVYLATPYSHADEEVKERRFKEASTMAAQLMEAGYLVFCPIAHSHPIEYYGMPDLKSGDWWLRQDFAILKHCDILMVYEMPGWNISYGVKKEIEFAKEHGIPIKYIKLEDVMKQRELFV
jgi:Domain of unknown function (DUF1937)